MFLFFSNQVVVVSSSIAVTSDIESALNEEFLDIQTTIENGFTLKRVRDVIRRYSCS